MDSTTIDLSEHSPKLLAHLMNHPRTEASDDIQAIMKRGYLKQLRISDEFFEQCLIDSNRIVFEGLDNFFDKNTSKHENSFFPGSDSNCVRPAVIVLGLSDGDRMLTLNLIQKHIARRKKAPQILRLSSDKHTRSSLLNRLSNHSKAENYVVLIDQADNFDSDSIDLIIHYLNRCLVLGITKRAMIIFCVLCLNPSLESRISRRTANLMTNMTTIVKNIESMNDIPQKMLFNEKLLPRILPETYSAIHQCYFEHDLSVANLKHIYQHMQLEHFYNPVSLISTDIDSLTIALKAKPELIEMFKSRIPESKVTQAWRWDDPRNIAQHLFGHSRHTTLNHISVLDQILCLFNLIRETYSEDLYFGFPVSFYQLYEEFGQHCDLSLSSKFFDALSTLRKISRDSLLKRIDTCLGLPVLNSKKDSHIRTILRNFKQKFENNDDSPDLINDLITTIMKVVKEMRNPQKTRRALHEAVYYSGQNLERMVIKPSYRKSLMNTFSNSRSYAGIILQLLERNTHDIIESELFSDFVRSVRSNQEVGSQVSQKLTSSHLRMKHTPLRRKFSRPGKDHDEQATLAPKNCTNLDDDLLKAIFVDLINAMEHMNLVKRDLRKSKQGVISRCTWLGIK